jgi:capsular polysaccharide biosynthesis protein
VFDGLGRTVAQYHPVVEPIGQAGVFNPSNDGHYQRPLRSTSSKPASPPNPPLLPFIGPNPPPVRMTGILLVGLYP